MSNKSEPPKCTECLYHYPHPSMRPGILSTPFDGYPVGFWRGDKGGQHPVVAWLCPKCGQVQLRADIEGNI